MDIAVSPYHLTTREAAAMVALMLGRRVVTMLPAPVDATRHDGVGGFGGIDGMSALQTASKIPTYRRFVESWAWTSVLWERGVLRHSRDGETIVNDMWAVTRHIEEDHDCVALRHFARRRDFPDDGAYLSAIAADLLKGGPDPGISVPVAAALDRFATRHSIVVARSNGIPNASLAQQAEARLAQPIATFSMPLLLQASAQRILHWREELEAERTGVATALRRLSEQVAVCSGAFAGAAARDVDALMSAANRLSFVTAERRDELMMGSADDEVRVIESVATISCVPLPWDAVLTSSVKAIDSLHPVGAVAGNKNSETRTELRPHVNGAGAIAKYDEVTGRKFLALVVKVVGQTKR